MAQKAEKDGKFPEEKKTKITNNVHNCF